MAKVIIGAGIIAAIVFAGSSVANALRWTECVKVAAPLAKHDPEYPMDYCDGRFGTF